MTLLATERALYFATSFASAMHYEGEKSLNT